MKRWFAALLCACFLLGFALGEEVPLPDQFYADIASLVTLKEGEELVLLVPASYYSGEEVHKGNTKALLTGACALHCGAVVMTNYLGQTIPVQEVAKANNISKTAAKYWTAFVSWGKLEKAFSVKYKSYNMAQYGSRLKANGKSSAERRVLKLQTLCQALESYAKDVGLIVHFNSTGQLNGSGKRHAIVILGYIQKNGALSDLIISDSSVPQPLGAGVRLSESSVPLSMLGEKKLAKADAETLALQMMDYVVSYRYVVKENGD